MKYDTICLSGGGIFGFTFIGVLDKLINENIINLNDINTWVGCSAGAIISFILILGYDIQEVLDFIDNFNFNILMPKKLKLLSIFNLHGLNNGNKFIFIFKKFIARKFDTEDLTFSQLYDLTLKNLIIIGTNYTNNTEEIFSKEKTPDMSIITAVRISISIPLIFSPVFYNSCYYIDGGLKNNFPYNHCNQDSTLGICINKNYINNNVINIFNIFKVSLSMILNNSIKYKNAIYINYINDNDKCYDLSHENIINMIDYGRNNVDIKKLYNDISTLT